MNIFTDVDHAKHYDGAGEQVGGTFFLVQEFDAASPAQATAPFAAHYSM
jgi:hypothetical protein